MIVIRGITEIHHLLTSERAVIHSAMTSMRLLASTSSLLIRRTSFYCPGNHENYNKTTTPRDTYSVTDSKRLDL